MNNNGSSSTILGTKCSFVSVFYTINSSLENSDFITLQLWEAFCLLDIWMVCHFVYTTSFRTHTYEIKLSSVNSGLFSGISSNPFQNRGNYIIYEEFVIQQRIFKSYLCEAWKNRVPTWLYLNISDMAMLQLCVWSFVFLPGLGSGLGVLSVSEHVRQLGYQRSAVKKLC